MREAGFSQRAAAKALGINRKTVKRYWDMDVDEYAYNARKIVRIRNLDPHRDQIVTWLREHPSLTAAQVCDWLKEHYEEAHAERTASRYVKELRRELPLQDNGCPNDFCNGLYLTDPSLVHAEYSVPVYGDYDLAGDPHNNRQPSGPQV